MAELRSLLKAEEQVRLYAISVDNHEQSTQFAVKIAADGKGAVTFPLLSDPDHRTIDAFGLRDPMYNGQENEGIPHPAVYVIDKAGRIAWVKVEENYKVRATNGDIRAALDALK